MMSLLQNDAVVLSMNSFGNSFHIVNKTFFSSAMVVIFGMYLW